MRSRVVVVSSAARATRLAHMAIALVLAGVLIGVAPLAGATPITYAVTVDATLNNPGGTWGGNLNLGAGQNVNLTVAYTYEGTPFITTATEGAFSLTGMQVFDNTNGLESAVITGFGTLVIKYDSLGTLDQFTGGGLGITGGGLGWNGLTGEFGDKGDVLPSGAVFDALASAAVMSTLIARAPDINDNVNGVNGVAYDVGTFTFVSSAQTVTESGSCALLALGLVGMRFNRAKRFR